MRFPHFYCARRDGNPTQWQSTGQASAPSRKRLQAEKRRPPALFPHHQAVVLAERCGKAGFNPRSQRVVKVEMAENRPSGGKARLLLSAIYGTAEAVPFQKPTFTTAGQAPLRHRRTLSKSHFRPNTGSQSPLRAPARHKNRPV